MNIRVESISNVSSSRLSCDASFRWQMNGIAYDEILLEINIDMFTHYRQRFVLPQAHVSVLTLPIGIGFCTVALDRYQIEREERTGSVCKMMNELLRNFLVFHHSLQKYEACWSRHSFRCNTAHRRWTTGSEWLSVCTVFCEKNGTGSDFDMTILCHTVLFCLSLLSKLDRVWIRTTFQGIIGINGTLQRQLPMNGVYSRTCMTV